MYEALREAFRAVYEALRAVLQLTLLRETRSARCRATVYEALSAVYEALSAVYEALSAVYEALSGSWRMRP